MDGALHISYQTIARFLKAAGGNYWNAVHVSCSSSCRTMDSYEDFLFVPDSDGRPVIFPLKDARVFFGADFDAAECTVSMTVSDFIRLYRCYLDTALTSDGECPIKELLHLENA